MAHPLSTPQAYEEFIYTFPHPNDTALAKTHPHHKHVPPDIKRHRVAAPNLSFTQPNLPVLIEEIEDTLLGDS